RGGLQPIVSSLAQRTRLASSPMVRRQPGSTLESTDPRGAAALLLFPQRMPQREELELAIFACGDGGAAAGPASPPPVSQACVPPVFRPDPRGAPLGRAMRALPTSYRREAWSRVGPAHPLRPRRSRVPRVSGHANQGR